MARGIRRTVTRKRASKYLYATWRGQPVRVGYYDYSKENIIRIAKLNNCERVDDVLGAFKSRIDFSYKDGILTDENVEIGGAILEPLKLLHVNEMDYIIASISPQKKCERCGTMYISRHTCNVMKASYYHHVINKKTSGWWQKIKFAPLCKTKPQRQVIITYDIETFTLSEKYGKRLVPYLIAFKVHGDVILTRIIETIARNVGFKHKNSSWYILHRNHELVGAAFRLLRSKMQVKIMKLYVKELCTMHSISNDVTVLQQALAEKTLKEQVNPLNYEVIVIGHNISGFDEVVLAVNMVDDDLRGYVEDCFEIRRVFMPRAGKILFNDVHVTIPNHTYSEPSDETFHAWRKGFQQSTSDKRQGVVFLVRDTYLLTHTSLRKAAEAYNLSASKGSCPYQAVNEFIETGTYEMEQNGYPVRRYWNNEVEYNDNKTESQYDIIKEAVNYCILDVEVTQRLCLRLMESYADFCKNTLKLEGHFSIFQRPTISSNTHAMFRQSIYSENGLDKYLPFIMVPSDEMYDHVRQSVRGGRCYPTFLGIMREPIYVYDICGMYASALTHPMPVGLPLDDTAAKAAVAVFQAKLNGLETISYFDETIKPMIVRASALPPENENLDILPPLCSRKFGKLCWTNEPLCDEIVTSIDLITMHNRGWRCQIDEGHIKAVWPEFKPICRNYVQINIKAKEEADREGNVTKRSISKLLSNALYGSFATKLDNKYVLFEAEMTENIRQQIKQGQSEIVASTTITSSKLEKTVNLPENDDMTSLADCVDGNQSKAFIEGLDHVMQNISFLERDCDELVINTIEDKKEWIRNNRYPTHLASFVLAWTRAFTSEWANILFSDQYGSSLDSREPRAIYGDTDSLFLTRAGHCRMQTVGKRRLKEHAKGLVYIDGSEEIWWAVECETRCQVCGSNGYATESIYLAPKLYALKDVMCETCTSVGKGKLRAKGHAKDDISYDKLLQVVYDDVSEIEQPHKTSRTAMKRTIIAQNSKEAPFTVMEKVLERALRTWRERTLWEGKHYSDGYLLYPYDRKHPNPRQAAPLTLNPFWADI